MALSKTAPPKAKFLSKIVVICALVCALSLAACGKKPAHVDPPDDDAPKFPAIYPNPAGNVYPAPANTASPDK